MCLLKSPPDYGRRQRQRDTMPEQITASAPVRKIKQRAGKGEKKGFFANLGPGLITGAADDDPSGISTYSVTGASFGYAPLWTALFSFPLMAAVQLICPRLVVIIRRRPAAL